ncbi:MAG TPA: hypothetical protein PLB45_03280 [Bacilli bacterium]|nr:hypothetical protein [Bacilli bacterium]
MNNQRYVDLVNSLNKSEEAKKELIDNLNVFNAYDSDYRKNDEFKDLLADLANFAVDDAKNPEDEYISEFGLTGKENEEAAKRKEVIDSLTEEMNKTPYFARKKYLEEQIASCNMKFDAIEAYVSKKALGKVVSPERKVNKTVEEELFVLNPTASFKEDSAAMGSLDSIKASNDLIKDVIDEHKNLASDSEKQLFDAKYNYVQTRMNEYINKQRESLISLKEFYNSCTSRVDGKYYDTAIDANNRLIAQTTDENTKKALQSANNAYSKELFAAKFFIKEYNARVDEIDNIAKDILHKDKIKGDKKFNVDFDIKDNKLQVLITPAFGLSDEETRTKYTNYQMHDGEIVIDPSYAIDLNSMSPDTLNASMNKFLDDVIAKTSDSINPITKDDLMNCNITVKLNGKDVVMPIKDFGNSVALIYGIDHTKDNEENTQEANANTQEDTVYDPEVAKAEAAAKAYEESKKENPTATTEPSTSESENPFTPEDERKEEEQQTGNTEDVHNGQTGEVHPEEQHDNQQGDNVNKPSSKFKVIASRKPLSKSRYVLTAALAAAAVTGVATLSFPLFASGVVLGAGTLIPEIAQLFNKIKKQALYNKMEAIVNEHGFGLVYDKSGDGSIKIVNGEEEPLTEEEKAVINHEFDKEFNFTNIKGKCVPLREIKDETKRVFGKQKCEGGFTKVTADDPEALFEAFGGYKSHFVRKVQNAVSNKKQVISARRAKIYEALTHKNYLAEQADYEDQLGDEVTEEDADNLEAEDVGRSR